MPLECVTWQAPALDPKSVHRNDGVMADIATVSFREQTTGKLSDLLQDEGLVCAHSQALLAYFVGALVNYVEEGVSLSPTIVLCESIDTMLQAFPGAMKYKIGEQPLEAVPGKLILKECASLCSGQWFIFVERIDEMTLRYGVAAYPQLPNSIGLVQGIGLTADPFCIVCRRITENTVAVWGARGSKLTLIFSTSREAQDGSEALSAFAALCASNAGDALADLRPSGETLDLQEIENSSQTESYTDHEESNTKTAEREKAAAEEAAAETEALRQGFLEYLTKAVSRAVAASHGTILLCADGNAIGDLEAISDGVAIDPALDFLEAYHGYVTTRSGDALLKLQLYEEALGGFMNSDGMVVLDTRGRVTGYRAFVQAAPGSGPVPQEGGARRRAYEISKSYVGSGIHGTLIRSQDGLILFHGKDL